MPIQARFALVKACDLLHDWHACCPFKPCAASGDQVVPWGETGGQNAERVHTAFGSVAVVFGGAIVKRVQWVAALQIKADRQSSECMAQQVKHDPIPKHAATG